MTVNAQEKGMAWLPHWRTISIHLFSGMEWWLKEYVGRRGIPPRKLLLAFGLLFVRMLIRLCP